MSEASEPEKKTPAETTAAPAADGAAAAAAPAAAAAAAPAAEGAAAAPTAAPKMKITPQCFKRLKLLGRGDVGRVYLVQLVGTDKCYAMKVLPKKEMVERKKVKRVQTEREILSSSNHPFIVTLHWSFQSVNCLYFVMDFCAGGEFFRALQRQPGHCLPESWAKFYSCEVLLALEYLHMLGFIYRDLKPENILMTSTGHIVLTDFDLSKGSSVQLTPQVLEKTMLHTEPGIITNSFVGTEEYIAPEVIKGFGHTSAVDWWTFGILLFEFLFGCTPFRGRTRDDTFGHILDGQLHFPERTVYPQISKQCKDMIQHLLHPDPQKRLGATHGACEVKKHAWYKGTKWELIRNQEPPIVPQLSGKYDTRYFAPIADDDLIDRLEAEASKPQKKLHTRKHGPAPAQAAASTGAASGAGAARAADPFVGFDSEKVNVPFAQEPTVPVPLATPITPQSSQPAGDSSAAAPAKTEETK